MVKIAIANDHAGYELKIKLLNYFKNEFEFIDLGISSNSSCNYVDFGKKCANYVLKHQCFGIIICGSGIGISIAANRFKGIRAANVFDIKDAEMTRKHNDANILALGARKLDFCDVVEIVKVFINTNFEGGRHQARIESLDF